MVWARTLVWDVVDVLAWLGASVLVIAGVLKVAKPVTATKFMQRLRFPAPGIAVRVVALVEIATGTAVLTREEPAPLYVAGALYGAFLVSLLAHRLRTGEGTVSCGCFGSTAVIKVVPHAIALAVAFAATVAAAVGSGASFSTVSESLSSTQVVLLVALLAVALLALVGAAIGSSSGPATAAATFRVATAPSATFKVLSVPTKLTGREER